ncbi:hypothetical protein OPIT5_14470 [Opitutaceae bacterium TAV5]|nr:hypothetical protein OPIT5_14470 [Opitutaceae bacterium TAV5]
MPHRHNHPASAFTLVELLTVIAIIGILAAILIPTVGRVRQTANAAACMSNMRQVGLSILLYTDGNKGRLPNSNNPRWDAVAMATFTGQNIDSAPYNAILRCKADTIVRTTSNPDELRSYSINAVLVNYDNQFRNETIWGPGRPAANTGMLLGDISTPSRVALLLERHDPLNTYQTGNLVATTKLFDYHQGGMNVVFCDARAARIKKTAELDAASTQYTGLNNFQATYARVQ